MAIKKVFHSHNGRELINSQKRNSKVSKLSKGLDHNLTPKCCAPMLVPQTNRRRSKHSSRIRRKFPFKTLFFYDYCGLFCKALERNKCICRTKDIVQRALTFIDVQRKPTHFVCLSKRINLRNLTLTAADWEE